MDGEDSIAAAMEDLLPLNLASTTDVCYQGFLGGAFDSTTQRYYVVFRGGEIPPSGAGELTVGIFDLVERAWLGLLATSASYDLYQLTPTSGFATGNVPGNTFFFPVEFTSG
jgi:hypothetical protein